VSNRTYTIYALLDPRDDAVRYIGLTEYPDERLKQHIQGDGNIPKRQWIRALRQLGLSPLMHTIEKVQTLSAAFEREGYWINHYLHEGAKLVNIRSPYSINHSNPSDRMNALSSSSSAAPCKEHMLTFHDLIAEAGIKRVELAAQSGVSTASIVRVSHGAPTSKITVIKLIKVLKKYVRDPTAKAGGLCLRSTATRRSGKAAPLWLRRATHPGRQATLGQMTTAPSSPSLAARGAFAS